ncbi:MAG: DUF6304 family protein [Flavobacteriales bacterium]|nr:DUF6304 family protein [Flavobacteriales bacterium]
MTLKYPVEYRDSYGSEKGYFISDGKSLVITIRNTVFQGHFWDLFPVNSAKGEIENLFTLEEFEYSDQTKGCKLSDYSLKVQLPIKVINADDIEVDGLINFSMDPYKLEFEIEGKHYQFEKPNFEYGLSREHTTSLNIKHVKCCVNCIYSEYSPYGSDEYGDLMCFKQSKSEWLKIGYQGLKGINNWDDLLTIEKTQEAFWCDEFEISE